MFRFEFIFSLNWYDNWKSEDVLRFRGTIFFVKSYLVITFANYIVCEF